MDYVLRIHLLGEAVLATCRKEEEAEAEEVAPHLEVGIACRTAKPRTSTVVMASKRTATDEGISARLEVFIAGISTGYRVVSTPCTTFSSKAMKHQDMKT